MNIAVRRNTKENSTTIFVPMKSDQDLNEWKREMCTWLITNISRILDPPLFYISSISTCDDALESNVPSGAFTIFYREDGFMEQGGDIVFLNNVVKKLRGSFTASFS